MAEMRERSGCAEDVDSPSPSFGAVRRHGEGLRLEQLSNDAYGIVAGVVPAGRVAGALSGL
jgi:hypothetical protein